MKKGKLKNFINKIKPFVRGVLKSVPFGGVIVEIADNVKAEKALQRNEIPKRLVIEGNEKKLPHNWASIIFQLLTAGIIVYAFVTKQITISDVLNYSKMFVNIFGVDVAPDQITTISDSLNLN